MQIPVNTFKRALRDGVPQIGLWVGLSEPYAAELLASTGFDWMLIDAEHAPNDPRSVLGQLQAIAAYPVHPIVRPVQGDAALIKQYLDIGTQTLLVPMIETAEGAARVVPATRYPTRGIRGVGSALARSSRWNQIESYLHRSDDEMCVIVQAESVAALENLPAICAWTELTAYSSGPPTCRPRWASSASLATRRYRRRLRAVSPPSRVRVRRRAHWPAIPSWRASTWRWAPVSSPSASIPRCWCALRGSWLVRSRAARLRPAGAPVSGAAY